MNSSSVARCQRLCGRACALHCTCCAGGAAGLAAPLRGGAGHGSGAHALPLGRRAAPHAPAAPRHAGPGAPSARRLQLRAFSHGRVRAAPPRQGRSPTAGRVRSPASRSQLCDTASQMAAACTLGPGPRHTPLPLLLVAAAHPCARTMRPHDMRGGWAPATPRCPNRGESNTHTHTWRAGARGAGGSPAGTGAARAAARRAGAGRRQRGARRAARHLRL